MHRPSASRPAPDVFPGPGVVQRGTTHVAPGCLTAAHHPSVRSRSAR